MSDGTSIPADSNGEPADDAHLTAAEYARLLAEAAQAEARLKDLGASYPDRDNTEAWEAHKAQEGDASEAFFNAQYAADAYLREHPDAVPVYGAARRWQAMGVSTIPVKSDGSKEPLVRWKQYQGTLPPEDELWRWHHGGHSGMAVLTGLRDGDDGLLLEMFEAEGRTRDEGIFDKFLDAIKEAGLSEVWKRITDGYWDISPSGGPRFWWYCEDVTGNTKLAQREATAEELAAKPGDPLRVLFETRGLGGYAVAAPTPGRFHETGRPWRAMGGLPGSIAIITPAEREQIFACARKFHTAPAGAIHSRKERARYETLDGPARPARGKAGTRAQDKTGGKAADKPSTRPGDLYNESGPDWGEILEPHGWRLFQRDADGTEHWTRPGKDRGTSATTGNPQHEGDKLHVFTSSTEFEPDESYSKFAAFAILNHDADFAAAAAQLRKEGYTVKKAAAAGGESGDAITDSHLAEQFAAEMLQGSYCWVSGWGWMAYREARGRERRGARWFRTDDKDVFELTRMWLRAAFDEFVGNDPDKGTKKAWLAHLGGRHVREVASLAAGIVKRDMAEFDTHPDLLNCGDCVLDLRTGQGRPHDPADMFTMSTGVDYVPGATHPDWTKALTALPAEILPWYQVRIGQAATGYVPSDEALLMNIGPGENGKTTVTQALRHALGDYYVQIPLKALLGDSREHDTVLMLFKGARLAALEETPEEGRLNMQQVKAVSTPQITGRYMRQDYVTYDSTHATMINSNHEPAIENADHGSLRRVYVVVYPHRHLKPGQPKVLPTDREGDPGLRDRIIAGGQGQHEAALAWMAEGARKWYEAGRVMPAVPERVQADTSGWLGRVNLMFTFGIQHLVQAAGRWVMSAELYRFFRQVIKDSGNSAWSERTFNARLSEFAVARGWAIEKKKTRHNKDSLSQPPVDFPMDPPASYQAWHGLRFLEDSDEEAEIGEVVPGEPGGAASP
jgi:putative DNA primase/helicase